MSEIKFSREEADGLVHKIKAYVGSELGQDIGSFEAEFLLEFFAKEVGPYFYNRGLADAHTLFLERTEELSYLIQELEKPTV